MPAKVSKERRFYCSECKQGWEGQREPPQLSAQEERRFKIQRCIQSLVHASHCRQINCQYLSCPKMKRVVEHTKVCKRKTGGGCRICQELIHLCCYHAKHCLERKCVVPFCRYIKLKLRQRQRQNLQQRVATIRHQAVQAPPEMPIAMSQMLPRLVLPGAEGQPHLQQPTIEMTFQEFPHEH